MPVNDLTKAPRWSVWLWLAVGLGLSATLLSAQTPWQMKQAPLMTQWAALVDTNAPLPEYPRPQLVRTNWLNLNGLWQFQPGATNDPVPIGRTLANQILVPYPMESAISGVMQYYEFSWYRRTFTVPSAWSGKHILLHLDAVDWQATIYVNGQPVAVHRGGYDPISCDITSYLNGGTNELIVNVYSPEDAGGEPRGKQTLYPGGVMYTSSSGIWQPAWLEPVDAAGVSGLLMLPDVDHSQLQLTVNTYTTAGVTVVATILTNGVALNTVTGSPDAPMAIPVPNELLWSPGNPFLYDLQVAVVHSGVTNDVVSSYFGMRKISTNWVAGRWRLFLNNQYLFELGPLDQGFWPDGLYTAPTDAALAYDLQMEKSFGFNLVRKHLKVERQRWYYWADKLGILVWQDMPSVNTYTGNANPPAVDPVQFTAELSALVTNHVNSPSIIMWDVFNEGQGEAGSGNGVGQTNTAYLVQLVETLDPSRLVNQASGWNWAGVGSVDDIHNYPDPGNPINNTLASVDGEFGSIGYVVPGHMWFGTNYSYGSAFTVGTTNALVSYYDYYVNELTGYEPAAKGGVNAGVYTEITDMETESAGFLTYDRLAKVDPAVIRSANQSALLAYDITTDSVTNSVATTNNFSFEADVAPPGGLVGHVPASWTAFNLGSAGDIGSQNAGGGDYSVNNPLAAPAAGNNYCYINLYYNPNSSTGIYEDVGALQANTTYALTVAIGSRTDIQTLPGIISLLNGTNNTGTVLASTNGVPATRNTWQDYTASVTTGASVSGDLTIELWVDPALTGQVSSGINNIQGDFDNVRLMVTPIVFHPPLLGPPVVEGDHLILTGTGGTPNAGYAWLTTTNLSAPILWTTNYSGTLDGTGAFSNAIPINAALPATWFRLRMP
jgi:hypothetical protein